MAKWMILHVFGTAARRAAHVIRRGWVRALGGGSGSVADAVMPAAASASAPSWFGMRGLAGLRPLSGLVGIPSAGAATVAVTSAALVMRGLGASCAAIVALNLVGFVITATTRTHLITDLVGSFSFTAGAWVSLMVGSQASGGLLCFRPVMMTLFATIWSFRLGGYLFYRILKTHKDERFNSMFPESPEHPWTSDRLSRLAAFWMIQAFWGCVVLLPVTVVNSLPHAWHVANPVRLPALLGLLLASSGLVLESVADFQKDKFKSNPDNRDKFMTTGTYAAMRYPNYTGEIMVWWGVYVLGLPAALSSFGWYTIFSPLFTTLLLRYVTGIPLREARYERLFGDNLEYQEYKKRTNLLIPRLFEYRPIDKAGLPDGNEKPGYGGTDTTGK
ncbi:hypothetical protein FVE85_1934 [Porphyridium purpureum]|uniref:Steroid 5-alpha reductase C-terminal domain-containing protein n=1 Tax=Porphyridium purpureum TaxID=35688 RepID=A0A5J4YW62_PORPP|nr:hypothetical protein FVE85_1934 [Porphyridium purpureum]|eukprot:POR5412..scf209_3